MAVSTRRQVFRRLRLPKTRVNDETWDEFALLSPGFASTLWLRKIAASRRLRDSGSESIDGPSGRVARLWVPCESGLWSSTSEPSGPVLTDAVAQAVCDQLFESADVSNISAHRHIRVWVIFTALILFKSSSIFFVRQRLHWEKGRLDNCRA